MSRSEALTLFALVIITHVATYIGAYYKGRTAELLHQIRNKGRGKADV